MFFQQYLAKVAAQLPFDNNYLANNINNSKNEHHIFY
jgi:hypothetical protein